MSTRVLFIASLHHPQALLATWDAQPPEAPRALFPSSMGQHFYERAMRQRGYTLAVFWRNLPPTPPERLPQQITRMQAERHSAGLTPGKVIAGLRNRLPPHLRPDVRQRNASLLAQARRFKPDVVWLVGDNTVILPETLATLKRETGCILVYASGTSPIIFSHAIERQAAPLYDLVLVNDYYHGMQWRELGAPRVECLPIAAIDPTFHKPQPLSAEEQAAYACDVTFVGTLVPDHLYSERSAALQALTDFNLGIWSVHDVPARLRPHLRGEALGPQMFRVLSAATISLNVHGNFMRYGGNMRLFEAAGLGAFQISDDRPGITSWFTPGEHLITYRDHADLRAQVTYALAHPDERHEMAEAARQHALAHHTYDHRLDAIETLLK